MAVIEIHRYTADELDENETLCEGQSDDLKLEEDGLRFWLARTGIEDGEPCANRIDVETRVNGNWTVVLSYDGDDTSTVFMEV